MFRNVFAFLQKVGKSLMLPVAILPVAGILLGVGDSRIDTKRKVDFFTKY